MPTLTAQDIYTRFMTEMFDDRKMISISTGFQSFFGNLQNRSQTLFLKDVHTVEIDIIRGDAIIAATIPRGGIGFFNDQEESVDQEYSSFARVFPLIREVSSISADKLLKRMANEPSFSNLTQEDRLRLISAKQHDDRIRKIMRTFELLASLSVMTGKQPAILDTTDPDKIYDFRRNSDSPITVSTAWDQGGSTIFADIDDACDIALQRGRVKPDMLVIGRDAFDPFLTADEIDLRFNGRRINQGNISINAANDLPEKFKRFTGNGGFEPRGVLMTPKGVELWVFSYNQYFEKPKGTFNYYMPEGEALVAFSGARADRYYGPGEVLPSIALDELWYQQRFGFSSADFPMPEQTPTGDIFDPRMFTFYATEKDRQLLRIFTEAGPIFATTQTDAFVVLKGLVT